jgi:hypothetical protein
LHSVAQYSMEEGHSPRADADAQAGAVEGQREAEAAAEPDRLDFGKSRFRGRDSLAADLERAAAQLRVLMNKNWSVSQSVACLLLYLSLAMFVRLFYLCLIYVLCLLCLLCYDML